MEVIGAVNSKSRQIDRVSSRIFLHLNIAEGEEICFCYWKFADCPRVLFKTHWYVIGKFIKWPSAGGTDKTTN